MKLFVMCVVMFVCVSVVMFVSVWLRKPSGYEDCLVTKAVCESFANPCANPVAKPFANPFTKYSVIPFANPFCESFCELFLLICLRIIL